LARHSDQKVLHALLG
jgi:hypothetical protein